MNKDTVIRLIKNQPIKQEEFTQFVLDCIEFKKKPTPTPDQLLRMLELFKVGIFNFSSIMSEILSHLNLRIDTLVKDGQIIRIDVYE